VLSPSGEGEWSRPTDQNLVSEPRQKIQLRLAFPEGNEGEALQDSGGGNESLTAKTNPLGPVKRVNLMQEVLDPQNLERAYRHILSNKGAGTPGVDGMTVPQLQAYLHKHWPKIEAQLQAGSYQPLPVKRVEIAKPDGGVRQLGIPSALDRLLQQAVLQVLQPEFDPTFSEHSYGFRPGRSAQQAVAQAQEYQQAGYGWVVDMDLEKFFDHVHHDRLLARLAERIDDKELLKLMRAFLTSGVLANGLVEATHEGTPQGGPLSPLLSNIVLDELDRELERRGHRFVRYADDCNIYVRSRKAAQRTLASVSRFVERKLRLKVNREKSAVDRPCRRKFLGFSFTVHRQPRRRIAPTSIARFKARIRELTRRTRGSRLEQIIVDLARYLRGWLGYFGFCQTPTVLRDLESWLHRRLRALLWKRWKRGPARFAELRQRGISRDLAAQSAGSSHSVWRLSRSPALNYALPGKFWKSLGLPSLVTNTT
jgi:RNA-directed DNA polymerase